MHPTPIKEGQPFSEERTHQILGDFKRDGYVVIPDVLEPEEMAALRAKTDSLLDDPAAQAGGYVQYAHRGEGRVDAPDSPFILRHTNKLDRIY